MDRTKHVVIINLKENIYINLIPILLYKIFKIHSYGYNHLVL